MQFQVNECTQRLDKRSEEIKTKHNTLQYIIQYIMLISFEKTSMDLSYKELAFTFSQLCIFLQLVGKYCSKLVNKIYKSKEWELCFRGNLH